MPGKLVAVYVLALSVLPSDFQLALCRFSPRQGYNLVTMNESFALASSATESASLPIENASVVPINPTVVTGELQGIWAMDYTCTQVPLELNSA